MADKMDRGLDEIIADSRSSKNSDNNNNSSRGRRGGGRRREPREDYPRDGVRKTPRDEPRNLNSEWVHDRYEETNSRRGPAPRRRRESPDHDNKGTKLRAENIHYDLTEEDLDELFRRIGPVTRLQLRYDRAGRSEGTAYVTYESHDDALEAIKQFDGANANGQPIRLTLLPSRGGRNPFDNAVMPGRPLAERISTPDGRSRSLSPQRRYDEDDAARKGIDRYVPGQNTRSRSPMPRRRGGRRPGARREPNRDQEGAQGAHGGQGGRGTRGNPRSKKTQEELDAEMEDYFGGGGAASSGPVANGAGTGAGAPAAASGAAHADDIDMIE